jgi:two-component system chemotaxis response regulator CheY
MNIEYLKVLAQTCKIYFEEMTKTPVVTVTVKREQRLRENYSVAFACDFVGQNSSIEGRVVMGFGEDSTACLTAAAISERMGIDVCREMDAMALDVLAEFLNTVMGRTVTGWDEAGLAVNFSPIKIIRDSMLATYSDCQCDSYVIILNLSFGWVVFGVSFLDRSKQVVGKKVLVVDDSRLIRGFLRQALEQLGLDVQEAGDGMEAKRKHQEFKPDLTIMDLIMPQMGGLEAILEIREGEKEAKFIILSSSAKKEERMAAQTLNVKAYLIKPVKVDELVEAVQKALTS